MCLPLNSSPNMWSPVSAMFLGPHIPLIYRFATCFCGDTSSVECIWTYHARSKSRNFPFVKKSQLCCKKCWSVRCRTLRRGCECVSGKKDVIRLTLFSIHNLVSNPITAMDRPWGFQEVEAPRFQDNRHMKVVGLSALHTGHLYPTGNIPGTHFC